jgi:hypothetical protein
MAFDWWEADESRTRMAFGGELPVAEARVVIHAVQANLRHVPVLPGQDPTDPSVISARRVPRPWSWRARGKACPSPGWWCTRALRPWTGARRALSSRAGGSWDPTRPGAWGAPAGSPR